MMKHSQPTVPAVAPRAGVTLTEVLMSMLIMSIGVSFVAAVFPLAVLRSIQGAQMTSATILSFQAEALIDMFPDLIHNPDGIPPEGLDGIPGNGDDRPRTFREHFGRKYLVDPWGYHVHLQDGSVFGPGNVPVQDWFGFDRFGAAAMQRFDGGILAQTNTVPGGVTAAQWSEHRENLAATLAASTDRWDEAVNTDTFTIVTDSTGRVVGVTLGPSIDLSQLDNPAASPVAGVVPDRENARITIFHGDGRQSQAYPLTSVVGQTVSWTEDFNGDGTLGAGEDLNGNGSLDVRQLPLSFADGSGGWDISHVTIEKSLMRQFSWLMSVRKRGDGNAGVDVAVVFNRGVDPVNEFAYLATFIPKTNLVAIERDSSIEPEPFLKKGGYIFDAQNCRWYRIQDFRERPTLGAWEYGNYEYVVFTEKKILEPGGEDTYRDGFGVPTLNQTLDDETSTGTDANGNGILETEDRDRDGALDLGRAVLLPGVIEVYPLGTKAVPENL